MKWFFSLIVVLGLGTAGYFLWKKSPAQAAIDPLLNRPTTATVEARDIFFAVNAAGDIGPADQVSVRPEVNGRIAELPVDIGDKVAKDALLCRLDDRDLQIERSSRLQEIDGARLQLQKATRNFGRSKQLFTDHLVSAEVYEDSKTEYDLATNALERSQSALSLVDDRISKTKILAPFDCTVLTRPVSLGQTVSGSAGFNSGTEVMTIANLKDMIINAHINQADVTRLNAGQTVEIQVESVPGLRMKGLIERIAPQAVIKNGIKGFAARVVIKDIDARIRPGMTALLSIPVASAESVLAVPLAAVFTEKGERYVFVKKDEKEEKFERRPILVGITDYSFAEVQDGLAAGDVVSLEQPAEFRSSKTTNSFSNHFSSAFGVGGAPQASGGPAGAGRGAPKPGGPVAPAPAAERPQRKATGS
jgi:HlyD family secretion protein